VRDGTLRMSEHRIFTTSVGSVHPLYVAKAERKGRTRAEVDTIICWLTGYRQDELEAHLTAGTDFTRFFADAPHPNPARDLITGKVCGVRVEDVEHPIAMLQLGGAGARCTFETGLLGQRLRCCGDKDQNQRNRNKASQHIHVPHPTKDSPMQTNRIGPQRSRFCGLSEVFREQEICRCRQPGQSGPPSIKRQNCVNSCRNTATARLA
jgi:hypothetical protein